MPVALDPDERFDYVISTDRQKPEDQRPTFVFHYPTGRERRQIARLFDEADVATSVEAEQDKTLEALNVILVDWRNVRGRDGKLVPFSKEALIDVTSDHDWSEFRHVMLSEMDTLQIVKKKLAFSSLFNMGRSESDAATEATSATPTSA